MEQITRVITKDGIVEVPIAYTEGEFVMRYIAERGNAELTGCIFEGLEIDNTIINFFKGTKWIRCKFKKSCIMNLSFYEDCVMEDCTFENADTIDNLQGCIVKNPKIDLPDINAIKEHLGAKTVVSLPNKMFVKVTKTCDFCHHDITNIVSRTKPVQWMKKVPNCDKYVCNECYKHYELHNKEDGHRTYGWHGPVNRFKTPMDKTNTAILGLEMEFEGDFYGWKELEDAHKGTAFYGHDSSVRGHNELSWDCGSYSWWKYLSPLKSVCKAIRENGGEEGPTAGIHIHVSRPDKNNRDLGMKLNSYCRDGYMRTLMEAVSLRPDMSRMRQYANLSESADEHHSGISCSGHGTCEFRIFACSLDEKVILLRMKFVKELYEMIAEDVPKSKLCEGFSKRVRGYIIDCANVQKERGNITESAYDELINKLK